MPPSIIMYPIKKVNDSFSELWLAGGCFWGTEEYFSNVKGVVTTAAGYANGNKENPSYKEVCTGTTGFAEAVYLQYDPAIVSLEFVLELYYKTINPHLINRQGADIGSQYRTGIYYSNTKESPRIKKSLLNLQKKLDERVVIEQLPLSNFYLAEEYHQEYLKKNPSGYCHIPKKLFDYAEHAKEYAVSTKDELRKKLTSIQFNVTQEDGTEPPFQNEYDQEFRKGIYVSITSGEPLFLSADKFDAGCGWPAFSRPITDTLLQERLDNSGGRIRTEVRSSHGNDHLGHVFEDGPEALGGLRYCINSAALRFVPLEQMAREGYQDYIKYIEL